jgi:riboflavin kinase/FMN adenylyltransferase
MDVYASIAAATGRLPGSAVAIGNFDGVHVGHRQLIERAVSSARLRGARAVALTFWPHPAHVLAPDREPPLITSRARRIELLAEAGLDAVIEQPFSRDFAALTPAEFTHALLRDLDAKDVIVGYDFTYGRQRGGTTQTLQAACQETGATLSVVSPVSVTGLVVSSTKVREFVLAGNVEAASELLSRPFDLGGEVVRGAGRGRAIGVPTANVAPDGADGQRMLLPAIGVYAVRVRLPDGSWALGACNVGVNPTFRPESTSGPTAQTLSVEVHILDRSIDLYGQRLRVAFVSRIRAERRFPGVEALVAQIQKDVEETRRLLS